MCSAALEDFVEVLGAGDHGEGQVVEQGEPLTHSEVALHVRHDLMLEYKLEFVYCFLDLSAVTYARVRIAALALLGVGAACRGCCTGSLLGAVVNGLCLESE